MFGINDPRSSMSLTACIISYESTRNIFGPLKEQSTVWNSYNPVENNGQKSSLTRNAWKSRTETAFERAVTAVLAEHPVRIDSSFSVDRVWRSLFGINLELQPQHQRLPLEMCPPVSSSTLMIDDRSVDHVEGGNEKDGRTDGRTDEWTGGQADDVRGLATRTTFFSRVERILRNNSRVSRHGWTSIIASAITSGRQADTRDARRIGDAPRLVHTRTWTYLHFA